MPTTSSDSVRRQLAELRASYAARLPTELQALAELTAAALAEPSAPTLAELQARLHRLAGSGGTFGMPELGAGARRIEQRLQNWHEGGTAPDRELLLQLQAEVVELCGLQRQLPAPVAPAAEVAAPPPVGPVRLWLIEDDPLLCDELGRQFESFGFEVRSFAVIADADRAAGDECPDILLLDVVLDGEDGNATERMPELPRLRALDCPVIFMSAYDDFRSRVRAVDLGAAGYYLKPLDVPRLANRMLQLLEARRAPPMRVLLVDDDRELSMHYRLQLQAAGMEVAEVDQPERIVELLAAFQPELLLLDLHMPGATGPQLAGVIRQHDTWTSLPIVYLSAETDTSTQIRAMHSGADDFLHKPISDAQLVSAVRVRVQRARQLASLIARDSLTGLLKHASIKDAADSEMARARRSGRPLSVAMVDIDHFKSVNDSHGHAMGDVVISSVAMLLRQRLRQSDLIGRYGGEEFAVVLPDCDAEAAFRLLDDIRQRFSAAEFSHAGVAFRCTLSAGLACSAQCEQPSAAELLVAADEALYAAKRGGRNRVRICLGHEAAAATPPAPS